MATRYFCDRCDTQHNNPEELTAVSIPYEKLYPSDDRRTNNVDLCNICLKVLHDAVKPLPKAPIYFEPSRPPAAPGPVTCEAVPTIEPAILMELRNEDGSLPPDDDTPF